MSNERKPGPNFKKLLTHKMAKDAIPDGGGLSDGIKFVTTPGALSAGLKSACDWCDAAILAMRHAGEPNPWKDSSEEEIAGELVRKIEQRSRECKGGAL